MKLKDPKKFPNAETDVQKFFRGIDSTLSAWREEEFPRIMEDIFYNEGRPDCLQGTTPISDRERTIFNYGYRLALFHVMKCLHRQAPINFGDYPPEPPAGT